MKKLQPYRKSAKKDSSIVVVYGTADSGKSSLVLTLTKDYKVAYFDVERMAIDRVEDIPDENVNTDNLYDMGTVDSLREILTFLESPEAQQVDGVVIDSMTHLLNKMTAHANPASLKGNAVFGYYRDLGRMATFICEKARERKVNIVLTAQAVKDKRGYEGVYVPDIVGKETPDTLRDLSDIMILVEKTGFGKRNIWLDTDGSFCFTKSKGLDASHTEKKSYQGIKDFTFKSIMGDKKLYIKPAPKLISKAQLKVIEALITEVDGFRPNNKIEINKLLIAGKIEAEKMTQIMDYEANTLIDLLTRMLEKLSKEPKKNE